MTQNNMKPNIVQLILAGSASLVLTGCIVFPTPSFNDKVQSGKRIQSADLAFVRFGDTTRGEFESKLGVPWTNYADLRVSVYYWESLTGHWIWGWAIPVPDGASGGGIEDITRIDILFVKFDQNDRVERLKIMHHPKKMTTKDAAMAWLSVKGSVLDFRISFRYSLCPTKLTNMTQTSRMNQYQEPAFAVGSQSGTGVPRFKTLRVRGERRSGRQVLAVRARQRRFSPGAFSSHQFSAGSQS